MMKIKRALVETPNGMMHYRYCGAGEPLLMMHQTADSSREFTRAMPLLGERYSVIALDTLGYGDSDPVPGRWEMGDFADSVAAFLDVISVPRCRVVGNHTGAGIAVELAARDPERVSALIAIGLTLWDAADRERIRDLLFQSIEVKADGSHLLEYWERAHYAYDPALEVVQRGFVDYMKAADYQSAYHAVFTYDMAPRLPLVQCPTLVMTGEHDGLDQHTKPAAALIPNGQALTIPGAHLHLADSHTERFVEIIFDFFAD